MLALVETSLFSLITIVTLLLTSPIAGDPPESRPVERTISLDSYFELKTSSNFGDSKQLDMLRSRINIKATIHKVTEKLNLTVLARGSYDDAYNDFQSTQYSELYLREAYLEYSSSNLLIKAGKQQIVWGIADIYRILDKVNPYDYQYFILDDYADSRIPLWTLNIGYFFEESSISLLILPEYKRNQLAKKGSTWEMNPKVPDTAIYYESREPDISAENMAYGFRWSAYKAGFDISLNYLYGYDYNPSIEKWTDGTQLVMSEKYYKTHTAGGTASYTTPLGVISGEAGYIFDKRFDSNVLTDKGLTRSDQIQTLLALYHEGAWGNLQLQYLVDKVVNCRQEVERNCEEDSYSIRLSQDFMDDTLNVAFVTARGNLMDDWYFNPEVKYDLSDIMEVRVGGYLFYGDIKGIFGQFRSQKQVYLTVKIYL